MPRVLIADKFPESQHQALLDKGYEVTYQPSLTAEELPEAIGSHHALCVRSTRVTEATLEAAEKLVMIVRVGSGTNTIAVKEASNQGIYVSNCPGKNAIAVAELALGLMLAVDRRIPQSTQSLLGGRWDKKLFAKADGLYGKTLGIVGLGQIGQEVARRAKAFGLQLLTWSKDLDPDFLEQNNVKVCDTLLELCEKSDIVSVHVPLLPVTRHLFGEKEFAAMKPDAVFINTSRGPIHDEEALFKAASERGLRFGLDVFEEETAPFASKLCSLPSFIGTPHIGASTQQAQCAVAEETLRVLTSFFEKGEVLNCINLQRSAPSGCQLIVRHFNRVGVLASVLDALQEVNINVEGMNNTIFDGKRAAVAAIQLDKMPSEETLLSIKSANSNIIHLSASPS